MCGIFCAFCKASDTENDSISKLNNLLLPLIKRRGPDQHNSIKLNSEDYIFLFTATVLWLQGEKLVPQPIESNDSVFLYNGDVFGGDAINLDEKHKFGDTLLFHKALDSAQKVSLTLSKIQGPYAFIYFNKHKRKLYFGRDIYGRRSLLIGVNSDSKTLILTSVATKDTNYKFIELPALGTFCFNLNDNSFELFPWRCQTQNFRTKFDDLCNFLGLKPFSIKLIQEIPLIRCKSFEHPLENDLDIYRNLIGLEFKEVMHTLLQDEYWLKKVTILENLLDKAVKERISTQPRFCHNCIFTSNLCQHALTGVLFSGGLDCSVLALLADKYVDKERPIDLFNVSFDTATGYKSPDRCTGLETLEELKLLRPDRKWNFVEINITREELDNERDRHVKHLIYPLNTILDDSLGSALWFASRGKANEYSSPCRVILVGMGADELFGGYTRHRNALKRQGLQSLHETLDEDWQNISHRNLARDDRVVSDHGRQLRTPYLDEDFVEYVRQLNCWEKSYPHESLLEGLGEKILLRSLAFHLGLKNASSFKKRALQFGSRIAKSKENAQDVSPRL